MTGSLTSMPLYLGPSWHPRAKAAFAKMAYGSTGVSMFGYDATLEVRSTTAGSDVSETCCDGEDLSAFSKDSMVAEVDEEEEGAKEESEFSMDGRLSTIKRFRRRGNEHEHFQVTSEVAVQLLQAEASKARDEIWQLRKQVESLRAALVSSDFAKQVVDDELRELRATHAEHVRLSQAQETQARDSTSQLEHEVESLCGNAPISDDVRISTVEALRHLTSMGILGKGSFGTVELVENASRSEQYALKSISKNKVTEEGLAEAVSNERAVMAQLNNNFIIRLIHAWHDRQHIFFLMSRH